jgi:hypothetical protein
MKNTQKWILGIALTFAALLALPFAWRLIFQYGRYQMMDYSYGWQMPMMYGGNGMMGFGVLFMWLISLSLLALIGLGIAWLIKALTAKKVPEDVESII